MLTDAIEVSQMRNAAFKALYATNVARCKISMIVFVERRQVNLIAVADITAVGHASGGYYYMIALDRLSAVRILD